VCGRATGRRGELRLAKLSLAVSDSFLPKRGNGSPRKRDERKREKEGRTRWALRYPPPVRSPPQFSPRSGILRPVKRATDFQFFFELHATSSRSNSLSRPPPRPRLLCTFSPPSLLIFPLSPELLPPVPAKRSWKRMRRTRIEDRPNEDNSCIDCRDAWNGTSSACPTSSLAGWLVGRLAD